LIEPNLYPIVKLKVATFLKPAGQTGISKRNLNMLNAKQRTHGPIAGFVLEAGLGTAIAEIVTGATAGAIARYHRFIERRRCARYYREATRAMAGLDDHMLTDIGWPGRYEREVPCRDADR